MANRIDSIAFIRHLIINRPYIEYTYFLFRFGGFKDGVFPGVSLLSLARLSGFPVDLAILFGPGLSAIVLGFNNLYIFYNPFLIVANGLGYEQLRGLAQNLASTHQTENPRGFSEVGENEQLLIANVVLCYLFSSIIVSACLFFGFNFKDFL